MKKIIMTAAMALLLAAAPVWAQSAQPSDEADLDTLMGLGDSSGSPSPAGDQGGLLSDGGGAAAPQPSSTDQTGGSQPAPTRPPQ
jgi:opacity protein-like surface antigen